MESNINLFWYTGWPDYITSPKFSMRWEGRLIPTETGPYRFHMKSFGPKRVFLDGKELPNNYTSVEAYTVPVELRAGKEYNFAFETANSALGAFRAQLFWKTPEIFAREKVVEPRPQTRSVYLPAGNQWVDFWTGQTISGGQTIVADAPIDKIPLLVRAGSIIPMGLSFNTRLKNRLIPLNCAFIPVRMEVSRSMKMRTTITIMKRASMPPLPFTGTTPIAG